MICWNLFIRHQHQVYFTHLHRLLIQRQPRDRTRMISHQRIHHQIKHHSSPPREKSDLFQEHLFLCMEMGGRIQSPPHTPFPRLALYQVAYNNICQIRQPLYLGTPVNGLIGISSFLPDRKSRTLGMEGQFLRLRHRYGRDIVLRLGFDECR